MKLFDHKQVEAKDAGEGSAKLKVRWLITKEMGAPNFAMRLFEMESSGNSPLHTHPWEHEVFVLDGEGVLVGGDKKIEFKAGDVIFVAPNEKHQFRNSGSKMLKFLCIVPSRNK